MKKLIYTGLIMAAFLTSCGETSKKGAWSNADIELMNAEVKKVEGDLESLGDKKQDFIDCYTKKVEAEYDNFATANGDVEGCKKLAMDCASEIM